MFKKILTPLLFVFIFFSGLLTYLLTMAPTFTFGDSGELISMITTLGIAHPTGFPLYIMLGKIFSFIPLGNPAFRTNFMSVLFGALTPALMFLAFMVYFKKEENKIIKYIIAAGVSLLFIFSYTLWSQAVMSRIYTLNAAFCAAILLLFFLYQEEKETKYLYLWALLTGLGAGLHLTLTAFSGLLWLHLAITRFPVIKKRLPMLLGFLFIGFSAYFYLFIRANSDAILKWSEINTLKELFSYITQEQYNMKKFARGLQGILAFFSYTKDVLFRELSILAVLLFFAGVIMAFINKFRYALTFSLIFLSSIIMLLFYGNYSDLKLAFRYLIPSYIIMAFFIAYLFHKIYQIVKDTKTAAAIPATFITLMLVLSFNVNSHESSKAGNYTAYNYASDLLLTLPDTKAGLFASGDNNIYPLAYFKFVMKRKPELSVYDNILTIFKDSKPLLEKSKSSVTNTNVLSALSMGLTDLYTVSEIGSTSYLEIPTGLIYRITDKPAEPGNKYWRIYPLSGIIREPEIFHDYEEREIVGTYLTRLSGFYKNRAMFNVYEWLLNKAVTESYDSIPVLGSVAVLYSLDPFIENYFAKAEKLYLQCYALNPGSVPILFNIGSFYGRFNKFKESAYYYELASRLKPDDLNIKNYLAKALDEHRKQKDKEIELAELTNHFTKGTNLIKEKKLDEAMIEFEKDMSLNPKLARGPFHIGLIYSMKNELDKALPNYKKALLLEPNNIPVLGNLGLIYLLKKDYKQAKYYFEKSLSIDPSQERIQKDLAKIKQMGY